MRTRRTCGGWIAIVARRPITYVTVPLQISSGSFPERIWKAQRKIIAGGWTLGGIIEARSGFTVPVSSSTGTNPGARPDILGSHESGINGNWGTGQKQYLNAGQFALPPTDSHGVNIRPGTLSRRALYGPGFGNIDIVLQKNFYVAETQRLQLRIDFYNLTNAVNFTRVNQNARSGSFGLLNRVAPPRRVQLMLRYSF